MSVIDARLLEILACPEDKGPLLLIGEDTLYNERLRRAYRIDDGIPVLLVDESREVDESEHADLLARAGAGAADPDTRGSGQPGSDDADDREPRSAK